MIKFDFLQTGGYPFEADTANEVDKALQLLQSFGHIAGNAVVLSGCESVGNTITDGVLFYNNEVFEFIGGTAIETVKVFTESIQKPFEDGDTNQVYEKRWMGFGTGAGSIAWSDFNYLTSIVEMQKKLVPVGLISMWSGSIDNLPPRWALCDGTNNTPNLKGRFIVGYDPNSNDYNVVGNTGGAASVTLTTDQMPSHNHTGTVVIPPHSHSLQGKTAITYDGEGGDGNRLSNSDNIGNGTITQTSESAQQNANITTNNKGGDNAHENRPPYYTLAYIIFKGE